MTSPLVQRMQGFGSTIFAEMTALASEHGAVNLGQGFPDTDGPASLLADVAANVTGGVNQYPPGLGVASLRTAVAEHQNRFYGLDVDPDHVLITTGATEAIASAILALCGPGDDDGQRLRASARAVSSRRVLPTPAAASITTSCPWPAAASPRAA